MAHSIPDDFNPSFCINAKVMRIQRLTGQIFRKHLSPFSISNSQVSLLFVLSKRKAMRQIDLSEFLALEKSSLNRNLNRLIEQGFLVKDKHQVEITKSGLDFVATIIPAWDAAMAEIRERIGEHGESAISEVLTNLKES